MANKCTSQSIVEAFTHYILKNGEAPKSVYSFCDENNWKEQDFYAHFSSFFQVESEVYYQMYTQTEGLLKKEKAFKKFDAQNKLLTFYFTFFEVLTSNRSLVLTLISNHKNKLDSLNVLKKVRVHFKEMVRDLDIETMELPHQMLEKFKEKGIEEAAWGQLLLIWQFWMEDTSAKFEKTDVYIEKSVKAGFDLLQTPPLNSVIDLGKFLFKEKIQNNA